MKIVKEISVNAALENVFAALTDPQLLPRWWGDGVNRWESDLHAGGQWASYGTFADGGNFTVKGVYRIVEPPAIVEMTVEHWGDEAWETTLRYELTAQSNGQTRVRVTHSGFEDEKFRDDHSRAWDDTLARMVAFVTATTAAC